MATRARAALAGLVLVLAGAGCGEEPSRTGPSPALDSASVPPPQEAGAPAVWFTDQTAAAGLTAVTWCGRPEKPHLLESGGSGLALLDYDLDGDLDLYLVSGWRLEGREVRERTRNVLYRNRGDGTFEDVSAAAGVDDDGWGNGVAVGDPNGDGRPDLLVTNFGPDVLYLNAGDGTFAREPSFQGIDGWSTGAVFFDADGDGDEDLYVAAYVRATWEQVQDARPTLDWKGTKVMFGPFGLEGEANQYFRNEGGARFVRATEEAGLTDVGLYYSFTTVAVDFDDDLDLDLYVANDSNPNYLYRNDGKGHFEEMGLWSGAAVSGAGASQAGMGVAAGDVDGDARVDLCVTNFADDHATLYKGRGRCLLTDVTQASGIFAPTMKPLKWGVTFSDFDLDGDLDLFIANGHIYPQADTTPGSGTTYAQLNTLLAYDGGRYVDVGSQAGPGLAVRASSRGVAVGDLDRDGDLDLVVSNVDAVPTFLRNDSPRRGAWLRVEAPGALRVEIEAGGRKQVRHHVAGGSYLSASDPAFHFGLGPARTAERVVTTWRDGTTTERRDVPGDQTVRILR